MSEPLRRRSLSTRERLDLFLSAQGRCQRCGWALTPGTRWEVDHVIPLALGGRNAADNMQVLCSPCHGGKTHRHDVPAIAKTARVRARHLGARQTRRPLPGGRQSRWKKKFDGTVVARTPRSGDEADEIQQEEDPDRGRHSNSIPSD
jgi:5-methylcytosine-specific restriction protein A